MQLNFKNIFKKTTLTKTLFFVLADIFFIAVSVWLAFILRFDANIPSQYNSFIIRMIILAVVIIVPVFYLQKLYSFSWAYVSTSEIVYLFKATTLSFALLIFAIYISNYFLHFADFPRSTIFISYVLVFVFCGAVRLAKRIYFAVFKKVNFSEKEKTLIVGAGDAGEQILRSILASSKTNYFPVGFVDDNPIKAGVLIHGLKVLGKIKDIFEVAQKNHISQIIIALPSADNNTIRQAVDLAKKAGIKKIKIAPPLAEIIKGEVSLKNLKSVEVEDLLGREQVFLDTKEIENYIKGKVVLITGAAGSIGSELSRQIAKFNPSLLLLLDQDETGVFNILRELESNFPGLKSEPLIADITDKEKISAIFKNFNPEIVFHAAAYKHVPLMEKFPEEAIKNNIFGTKILAENCVNFAVKKFIFVSTDKAVNPTSVMGATKRIGEMICRAYSQKNSAKFICVRFGNVLNSRGSVIPIFKEQIKRGGPVEVTHKDMKRYFMLTSEACLLVMQAGAMGKGGEVFVLDMGKPIKILDLAKEMIKLSGLEPDKDIAIVFTKPRPGEKLFEEILTAEEGTVSTQNKKIFVARQKDVDFSSIEEALLKLERVISAENQAEIHKIIFSLLA